MVRAISCGRSCVGIVSANHPTLSQVWSSIELLLINWLPSINYTSGNSFLVHFSSIICLMLLLSRFSLIFFHFAISLCSFTLEPTDLSFVFFLLFCTSHILLSFYANSHEILHFLNLNQKEFLYRCTNTFFIESNQLMWCVRFRGIIPQPIEKNLSTDYCRNHRIIPSTTFLQLRKAIGISKNADPNAFPFITKPSSHHWVIVIF